MTKVRDVTFDVRITACQPVSDSIGDVEQEIRNALKPINEKYEMKIDLRDFEEYDEKES
jgi:hypothetical protein